MVSGPVAGSDPSQDWSELFSFLSANSPCVNIRRGVYLSVSNQLTTRGEVMKTIRTFSDGGRVVELADGLTITVMKSGSVVSLSDWCRVNELVRSGVLARDAWKGNGMYGHDTYKLIG